MSSHYEKCVKPVHCLTNLLFVLVFTMTKRETYLLNDREVTGKSKNSPFAASHQR